METLKIYKLHFTSPLHISDEKAEDYSTSLKSIDSDTFYAAITSCLAKLGQEIPDGGDLGFTMSNLFPFYQKDENAEAVFFFPKPLKQTLPNLKDVGFAKKIKKVQWLDLTYFSKLIKGEPLFTTETVESDIENIKSEYLTDKEINSSFVCSAVAPRVTVSRTGQEDAKPFYMDRIEFKDNSGLYVIVNGDTTLLDLAINLLRLEGIGSDRNVGNGTFDYETTEIQLEIPKDVNHIFSLSTFIPESKEQFDKMLDGDDIAYDFKRRGGWISTPPHLTKRKNSIYAFTSGSQFVCRKNSSILVKGKIVDLNPNLNDISHPIYRSGKAIFIPIKL